MKLVLSHGEVAPLSAGLTGLEALRRDVDRICEGAVPLRLSLSLADETWRAEVDALQLAPSDPLSASRSMFAFRPRRAERTSAFTAVMLVPTGIDCAVGGHAGDATPAARLLATACDHLIVHPNVVNASDINEQPPGCLYVEGSLICRLLMGAISVRRARANRILVVTEARDDGPWAVDQVVNTASAARATLGANCVKVAVLRRPIAMHMERSPSGRAVGQISGVDELFAVLRSERGTYDAVALATRITASSDTAGMLQTYFRGDGPNPWGGVEATLTHAVSMAFDVPSAHAPTMEEMQLRMENFGRTDPRKAAEAISTSYGFCILKGLHQAPSVVADPDGSYDPSVIGAEDVSCLVIPDGVVGMPVIAACLQGIPVIAVRGNTNLMRSDLRRLPFAPGQLSIVENYLEATGLVMAMRAGIHPSSVLRPLAPTLVDER